LKECAVISKSAGGIGVSVHNIRPRGSYIRGTNGTSNGIVESCTKNKIIYDNGSLQNLSEIPAELKVIYKTVKA